MDRDIEELKKDQRTKQSTIDDLKGQLEEAEV